MSDTSAAALRTAALSALAMIAFAGNSLLCRLALGAAHIDALTFTAIRIVSGAVVLWLVTALRTRQVAGRGSWISALALLAYAACFSWAYRSLPAASGALLLFAAVQATMIGVGLRRGERLHARQVAGLALAVAGLIGLLLPGLSQPPFAAAGLMVIAGIAWGVYSLRGRGGGDPTRVTAGNFLRAAPLAVLLALLAAPGVSCDTAGVSYAIASGALTSGLGYALWYAALPALKSTSAAVIQLSVPVLATLGGAMFLAEPVSLRIVLASATILGGIALVVVRARPAS